MLLPLTPLLVGGADDDVSSTLLLVFKLRCYWWETPRLAIKSTSQVCRGVAVAFIANFPLTSRPVALLGARTILHGAEVTSSYASVVALVVRVTVTRRDVGAGSKLGRTTEVNVDRSKVGTVH